MFADDGGRSDGGASDGGGVGGRVGAGLLRGHQHHRGHQLRGHQQRDQHHWPWNPSSWNARFHPPVNNINHAYDDDFTGHRRASPRFDFEISSADEDEDEDNVPPPRFPVPSRFPAPPQQQQQQQRPGAPRQRMHESYDECRGYPSYAPPGRAGPPPVNPARQAPGGGAAPGRQAPQAATAPKKTLRALLVLVAFIVVTFYAHMLIQREYYARCKSNVFRVVLFKQSHMCTHMHNVLALIENTYFFGMKRVVDTLLVPLYNAGVALPTAAAEAMAGLGGAAAAAMA